MIGRSFVITSSIGRRNCFGYLAEAIDLGRNTLHICCIPISGLVFALVSSIRAVNLIVFVVLVDVVSVFVFVLVFVHVGPTKSWGKEGQP